MGWRDVVGDLWGEATDLVEDGVDLADDAWDGVTDLADDAWDGVTDLADDANAWAMDRVRGAASGLQGALADLQSIGWGDPRVVIPRIVQAAQGAWERSTEPPGPTGASIRDAASGWIAVRKRFEAASGEVEATASGLGPGVWEGPAGGTATGSLHALATRLDSVTIACRSVADSLDRCADEVDTARAEWETARGGLTSLLTPTVTFLDDLSGVDVWGPRAQGIENVVGLIGSYDRAGEAMEQCAQEIAIALDGIQLPDHLAPGLGAVEQANVTSVGIDLDGDGVADLAGDDTGPLRGDTAQRAAAALAAMSQDERAAAEALLDEAGSSEREAWLLAAVASGLTGAALTRYARGLAGLSDAEVARLDPANHEATFVQPDQTTCGSSTLVMAKMLNDPAYLMYVMTGEDARGADGHFGDSADTPEDRFAAEALAMHDRTNTWWPEFFGTFPSSASDEMSGSAGVPGTSYGTRIVDPGDPLSTYDDVVRAVDAGHSVPMYSYGIAEGDSWGSTGSHVTLAVGTEGGDVVVYNPADGTYRTLTPEQWTESDTRDALSWRTPMTVALPTGS
ncbi:hypothetical protein JQN72_03690 [Phycicoccus sp. CSK15P-2]|uniref:hypothetical protein n=1 Tax=Phycicoccus sp. CSK15P-2 TaxID=2807627 RepID=UPI001950075B|nr:hypothetical protein [Phycicoccus sp. CSK15P-2]MBM6403343.1 hypothetical protein [Phycicoccus sp. CSK15P-2]